MTDQNLKGKLFLLHNMNITSVSGNICSRMWEKSEHELNKNSDVTVLMTQRSSTSCTTWSENEVLKLELLYSGDAEHILLPFVLKTCCDSCLSFFCIKCWAALITGACFASYTLGFCFTGFQLFFSPDVILFVWCKGHFENVWDLKMVLASLRSIIIITIVIITSIRAFFHSICIVLILLVQTSSILFSTCNSLFHCLNGEYCCCREL